MVRTLGDLRRPGYDMSRRIECRFHDYRGRDPQRLHLGRIMDRWVGEEHRLLVHSTERRRRGHVAAGRLGRAASEAYRVRQATQERCEGHSACDEALVEGDTTFEVAARGAVLARLRRDDAADEECVQSFPIRRMR